MRAMLTYLKKRFSLSVTLYLALIYIMLYALLLGVELVVRGTSSEVLQFLIVWGVLVGWLLGRSSLKGWLVVVISVTMGAILTLLRVSGIDIILWDLLFGGVRYLWQMLIHWSLPDAADLLFQLSVIQSRFLDILSNISLWMNSLFSGAVLYNQISTLLSWGFLLWSLAVWFSWITRRKALPLWGMIPVETILAILMTYTLEKRILLAVVLGAGLTLIGLINHDQKQKAWRSAKIKGADNVRERMILVVIGFSVYVMLVAALMPSIRVRAISDPFERLVYGDRTAGEGDGDGSVETGAFNPEIYTVERFAGMPRQKLIGSGPELAKRVVMIVRFPGSAFIDEGLPNVARYWRSYTYDQYTGSGWQSSPTEELEYKPGQELVSVQSGPFEIVTQDIRLSNTIRGTLYSAGPPITLDQEVRASWRTVPGAAGEEENQAVMADDLFAVTIEERIYQVRSLISTADADELRQAGGMTPEWIADHYLALPETVPARVTNLAWEIVTNQPTEYDRAKAIETFLRSYPYSLNLPTPPMDRDVADYFLFDLQTGYCDYYATAMVVLARSVGLPARLVVGFVGGQYDRENNRYLVSEAEAHTWVEVYFAGFGWIPFEPTASRSLINDQELSLPLPPELEQLPQVAETATGRNSPGWRIGLGSAAVLAVMAWLFARSDWERLKRMDATSLILTVYLRLFRYGRWLGLGHFRSDTLYEFEGRIKVSLEGLITSARRERVLQDGLDEISVLTDLAVQANYSPDALDPGLRGDILQHWKKLRTHLRAAIWWNYWMKFKERLLLGLHPERKHRLDNGVADE
jgi:transglutaminase-like putative cysteine protease